MPDHSRRSSTWSSEIITVICGLATASALLTVATAYFYQAGSLLRVGVAFTGVYIGIELLNRRAASSRLNFKPILLSAISVHCVAVAFGSGLGDVQLSFFMVSLVVWLLMYHDAAILRLIGAVHLAVAMVTVYLSGGQIAPDAYFTHAVLAIIVASFTAANYLNIRSNRAYWSRMADLEDELSRNELSLKQTAGQLADQHRDLSDSSRRLRETAARNARQVEELKLALAEQSQIAQAASSDLRQPLRNISSFVQLIGRRLDRLGVAAEVGEYLDFVTDGAARMNQMVDDLLRYSESPEPSAPVPVDTAETIRSIQRNLDDLFARERGTLTFCEHMPVIHGQPTQVLQLFQNLISNGIKFKRPGVAPTCHVACGVVDGVACFSVSDNGIGIPQNRLKDVFGLFTRLHERGAYEGTGIGLATCRRIVIAAGGHIWAESTEGEGTTFRWTWPLGQDVRALAAEATAPLAARPSEVRQATPAGALMQ